jgi:hypothetical protein
MASPWRHNGAGCAIGVPTRLCNGEGHRRALNLGRGRPPTQVQLARHHHRFLVDQGAGITVSAPQGNQLALCLLSVNQEHRTCDTVLSSRSNSIIVIGGPPDLSLTTVPTFISSVITSSFTVTPFFVVGWNAGAVCILHRITNPLGRRRSPPRQRAFPIDLGGDDRSASAAADRRGEANKGAVVRRQLLVRIWRDGASPERPGSRQRW